MHNSNQPAAVTARIDQLVEKYQALLIENTTECWQAGDPTHDRHSQVRAKKATRRPFDAYADGVSDAAKCLGDENLKGVVRAFAAHKKMAMSTFVTDPA